jgi:hypothetical protein
MLIGGLTGIIEDGYIKIPAIFLFGPFWGVNGIGVAYALGEVVTFFLSKAGKSLLRRWHPDKRELQRMDARHPAKMRFPSPDIDQPRHLRALEHLVF